MTIGQSEGAILHNQKGSPSGDMQSQPVVDRVTLALIDAGSVARRIARGSRHCQFASPHLGRAILGASARFPAAIGTPGSQIRAFPVVLAHRALGPISAS